MTTPTPTSPQELYQLIKDQELSLPSLDPRATVVIGTLDGATGAFDWAIPLHEDPPQTTESFSPDIVPPNDPTPFLPGYYRYTCPASVLVTLRFQVINRSGEFVVSGFGQVATAQAGQDYADLVLETILAPGQNNVSCFIQYGAGSSVASFQAAFVILQLPVSAVGAFTIPALPVSIIYAPPQAAAGSASKFTSTYTSTTSLARAITTSVSSTNSTKGATNYTASTFITAASSAITDLAAVATAIATAAGGPAAGAAGKAAPYVKGVTGALDLIAQNINSTTVSQQTGITITSSSKVTVSLVEETQISTFPGPGLGPGVGDIFYYLSNVLVAWLAVNGELGILVLASGSQTPAQFTAQDLRAGDSGLEPAVVNGLLALDPFEAKVSYPELGDSQYYYLPADRFVLYESPQIGPGNVSELLLEYVLTQENIQTSVQTQTTITDFKPGFLESVFGDNQATESTVTMSYSVTDDVIVGDSTTAQFNYTIVTGDPTYHVDVWYDLLFGTYAYCVPGQETQQIAFTTTLPPGIPHPVPGR